LDYLRRNEGGAGPADQFRIIENLNDHSTLPFLASKMPVHHLPTVGGFSNILPQNCENEQ
jgi:hypothetical protein